jgi:fructokinase
MSRSVYAAIEAGGTKVMCAIGDGHGRLLERVRLPTRDPATTWRDVGDWLQAAAQRQGVIRAIGIGSFGPLELDTVSPQYGELLRTPKLGWSGANLLVPLASRFPVPIALDTDVNAAALAECRWGAGQGLDHLAYITVGTGIGVGLIVRGRPLHGLLHPEAGHLLPRRHPGDLGFAGVCPFHGDCFEGVANGPALHARLGHELGDAPAEHPLWDIEADYLGQLCAQIVLLASPQRIVLGGGVMQQTRLFAPVRARMRHWLGGYVDRPQVEADVDAYVVAPGLGTDSGILGALHLAIDAGHAQKNILPE